MKPLKTLALSALMMICASAFSLLSQMVNRDTFEKEIEIQQVHTQPVDGVLVMNDAINYPLQ